MAPKAKNASLTKYKNEKILTNKPTAATNGSQRIKFKFF